MVNKIDDSVRKVADAEVTVNERGTVRIDGKTEREYLKEYRERFGEKRYSRLKGRLAEYKP